MAGNDRTDDDRVDAPLAVDELFGILGNETRMRVLRILWAEFDFQDYVVRQQEPISFSELQERARVDDSGNFNYHLGKLEETLVERREEGYVLTSLGYNLVRAITTYTAYEYRTIEPTVLEEPCPFCDGTLVASYEREFVRVDCEGCDGLADGHLNYVHCPATDVKGLDLGSMLAAATLQLMARVRTAGFGFCGQCHSRTTTSIHVCEDHPSSGTCETCRHRFGGQTSVDCLHCGSGGEGPLLEHALVAPSVLAFFGARGCGPRDVGPWQYRLAALSSATESLDGSPGVRYAFEVAGARHRVVVAGGDRGIDVRSDA